MNMRKTLISLALCAMTSQALVAQTAPTEQEKLVFESLYLNALQAKLKGDYQNAFNIFAYLNKQQPTNPAVLNEMAKLLNASQDYVHAAELAEKAVANDTTRNREYIKTAIGAYAMAGQQEKALPLYDKLLAADPADAQTQYEKFALLATLGHDAEALRMADAIKTNDPDIRFEVAIRRVLILANQKKYRKAFKEADRLYDKYPDNARVNYVLSRLFYLKGDINASIAKCKDAAECPDGASFIFILADLYETQHMDSLYAQTALKGFAVPDLSEEAKVQKIYEIMNRPDDMFHSANWYPFLRRVFYSLSRQYPGSADVCSLFETFYKTNGHAAQADSLLRSFVDANPGTEYIWANIIGYAQNSGKASNSQMIDFCKRAAEDVPSNPLFSIYLGQYYSADNQPALGLKAFGDAFSAYDNVESSRREDFKQYRLAALNGMALCYEKMDSLAQAFMVFDQILEDDPDDAMALNNYAYYLARTGKDLLRAEKMSMKSLNLEPLNPTFLDTYAYILFREQKYQEALFVMERCMENYNQGEDDGDESGTIFEHYGDILSCLGRTEEALHQWRKALKREPDNDLIKKKIDEKKYIPE